MDEVRSLWKVLKCLKHRNSGEQVNDEKRIQHMHQQIARLAPHRYVPFDVTVFHRISSLMKLFTSASVTSLLISSLLTSVASSSSCPER
mmetsp:Transcript_7625/g.11389  ORF Transcript_7625/g.11389 Transcript_7625/m.11389 type:complete len:89 (-) Transcript_7625:1657-1923(-)